MNINDTHFAAPRENTDEAAEFAEEFDRLLDESSLGAPNAHAIRQLVDPAKVEELHERALSIGREVGPDDADAALLELVRNAAHGFTPRPATEPYARPCPQTWPMGAGASWGMLAHLAEADVFRYVHRDIARLVLDIVLRINVPPRLARLTNGAIESSGIADDVVAALLPVGADPAGPAPGTRDSPIPTRDRTPLVARTSPFSSECERVTPTRPVGSAMHQELRTRVGRNRIVTERSRLDELIDVLAQFIGTSFTLVITGKGKPDAPPKVGREHAVDRVDALILAPLYEGPKNTRELESAVRVHLGLRDLSADEFKERLHHLYRNRLISRAGRSSANRPRAHFRLTGTGQETFTEWLTHRPDRERAEVVLRILGTTMFNSTQRARLVLRYEHLRPDQERTAAICRWMADNLSPELFRTCSSPDPLGASYELLKSILGDS